MNNSKLTFINTTAGIRALTLRTEQGEQIIAYISTGTLPSVKVAEIIHEAWERRGAPQPFTTTEVAELLVEGYQTPQAALDRMAEGQQEQTA